MPCPHHEVHTPTHGMLSAMLPAQLGGRTVPSCLAPHCLWRQSLSAWAASDTTKSRLDVFQQAIMTENVSAEPAGGPARPSSPRAADAQSPAQQQSREPSLTASSTKSSPPAQSGQAASTAGIGADGDTAAAGTQQQGVPLLPGSESSVSTSASAVAGDWPATTATAPQSLASGTALQTPACSRRPAGLVYDAYMELHIPPGGQPMPSALAAHQRGMACTVTRGAAEHQEQPGRTRAIWAALCNSGLAARCRILPACLVGQQNIY